MDNWILTKFNSRWIYISVKVYWNDSKSSNYMWLLQILVYAWSHWWLWPLREFTVLARKYTFSPATWICGNIYIVRCRFRYKYWSNKYMYVCTCTCSMQFLFTDSNIETHFSAMILYTCTCIPCFLAVLCHHHCVANMYHHVTWWRWWHASRTV